MQCTVEYDGLRHRWVRRWAKRAIRDEQVLLHLSNGQTVPVVLMTCCFRAARFLTSSATRDSSNDTVANWHVVLDQMELCSVTGVADRTSLCWS